MRDNLTSASDQLDPAEDVTYGYDARQMLESAGGPWGALGYAYDGVGNRTSRSLTPPGGSASVDTYAYPAGSNRLTTITNPLLGTRSYGYDDAGNTTGELRSLAVTGDWSYGYDALGRLATVGLDGSAQADYLYNALGQQVHRTVWQAGTPVATLSVHDRAGNRIAEHDGAGAVIREYIWLDGRPLAVIEGGQVYHLHWDHILRPVLATNATGTVVWAARYLPFGGIDQVSVDTGALEQDLRFPGQWFQAETGLHQNWMRDYDPTTGRYLQADPLGLVDGASVYGYARQSPLRQVDPDGQQSVAISIGRAGQGLSKIPHPAAKAAGICLIGLGILLSSSEDACAGACGEAENNRDEECEKTREVEETLCVAIAGARYQGNPAQAIAICKKAAFRRYAQCLRGVPEAEREPLTGVHTPI